MTYLFATDRPDYSDLASGRVFYSLAGHPAFPVRLGSEIFQRCLALRQKDGLTGRCVLYDPCCGAGYLLGVISCLHLEAIKTVIGSDIDAGACQVAGRNLGLLHQEGLERRMTEIEELLRLYGKDSHRDALSSCLTLRGRIGPLAKSHPLETRTFQADAFDGQALAAHLGADSVDIVLTDVPYGLHSSWQGLHPEQAATGLLDALLPVLAPGGLAAVAADKSQKMQHDGYQRLDRFQVGKRRVVILKKK